MIDPIGNRLIVEVKAETKSGIIIVQSAAPYKKGVVLKAGEGKYTLHGEKIPMTIKVGDTVVFDNNAGKELSKKDGKEIRILFEDEVWGTENE